MAPSRTIFFQKAQELASGPGAKQRIPHKTDLSLHTHRPIIFTFTNALNKPRQFTDLDPKLQQISMLPHLPTVTSNCVKKPGISRKCTGSKVDKEAVKNQVQLPESSWKTDSQRAGVCWKQPTFYTSSSTETHTSAFNPPQPLIITIVTPLKRIRVEFRRQVIYICMSWWSQDLNLGLQIPDTLLHARCQMDSTLTKRILLAANNS